MADASAPTAPSRASILVVHKLSRYDQLVLREHDEHVTQLIEQQDVSVSRLLRSHEAHTRSLEIVTEALAALGATFDVCPRGEAQGIEAYDLVITVGGDGTVLDLSHQVAHTPVLAINSDPEASVGYFCAGTAARAEALIERALDGAWKPTQLRRFAAQIDDQRTPPVLNELLVCHANPAAVSSYIVRIDGHEESQRSSGVWIATPAGSTAAIRSAGGLVVPLEYDHFQYVVREPYATLQRTYRQLKGIHPFGARMEIISKMRHGRVFIDGPHIQVPFDIGARLHLDFDVPSLNVYGLNEARRTA